MLFCRCLGGCNIQSVCFCQAIPTQACEDSMLWVKDMSRKRAALVSSLPWRKESTLGHSTCHTARPSCRSTSPAARRKRRARLCCRTAAGRTLGKGRSEHGRPSDLDRFHGALTEQSGLLHFILNPYLGLRKEPVPFVVVVQKGLWTRIGQHSVLNSPDAGASPLSSWRSKGRSLRNPQSAWGKHLHLPRHAWISTQIRSYHFPKWELSNLGGTLRRRLAYRGSVIAHSGVG